MGWVKRRSKTAEASPALEADWVDGFVNVYRSGDVVTVVARNLAVVDGVTGSVLAYTLPTGFKPVGLLEDFGQDSRGARTRIGQGGGVQITNPSTDRSSHSWTFLTKDPMPS